MCKAKSIYGPTLAILRALVARLNWEFILPSLLLVGVSAARLKNGFLPLHDSMQVFHIFYFYYADFYFFDEVPDWLPYCSLGLSGDFFHLAAISPANYFCLILGKLLHVQQVLVLFKLSELIEQLFFLMGVFLLSRCFFLNRCTVLLVCLGTALSIDWYSQIWWNLRIYYLFPLGLYLVVQFFDRKNPCFLWLAGLTFIGALIGNLPYYAPLWLFQLMVFAVCYGWNKGDAWRSLLTRSRAHFASLGAFLVAAASYLYVALPCMNNVALVTPEGRDPDHMVVGLNHFLTRAGPYNFGELLNQLVIGWPIRIDQNGHFSPDQTIYVGLLPLFFALWAIWWVRSRAFLAMAALFLATLGLTSGGLAAACAYFFPGMQLFRYLYFLFSFCKVLLLIVAGFGIDHFLRAVQRRHVAWAALALMLVADLFVHYEYFAAFFQIVLRDPSKVPIHMAAFSLRVFVYLGGMGLVILCDRLSPPEPTTSETQKDAPALRARLALRSALVCCYLLDLLFFNAVLDFISPTRPNDDPALDCFSLRRFDYQEERGPEPTAGPARDGYVLMNELLLFRSQLNQTTYGFLEYDACGSSYFTVVMSPGVSRLIQTAQDPPKFFGVLGCESRTLDSKPSVLFGCGTPKLRLVARARYTGGVDEAAALVRETTSFPDVVILQGDEQHGSTTGSAAEGDRSLGTVKVKEFRANEIKIEAEVAGTESVWLVYADAYHPEWHATVNGQPAAVEVANLAFKSVRLLPGTNVVQFQFRSDSPFRKSCLLLAAGFSFCLVLGIGFVIALFSPGISSTRCIVDEADLMAG